jgi:hypothetical protein
MTQHPMTEQACTCGYLAVDAEDLTVHCGEMFIPADDIGPDGLVHAESARDAGGPALAPGVLAPGVLACRCGVIASVAEFDQHLADVFTPADRIGTDGRRHAAAGA